MAKHSTPGITYDSSSTSQNNDTVDIVSVLRCEQEELYIVCHDFVECWWDGEWKISVYWYPEDKTPSRIKILQTAGHVVCRTISITVWMITYSVKRREALHMKKKWLLWIRNCVNCELICIFSWKRDMQDHSKMYWDDNRFISLC